MPDSVDSMLMKPLPPIKKISLEFTEDSPSLSLTTEVCKIIRSVVFCTVFAFDALEKEGGRIKRCSKFLFEQLGLPRVKTDCLRVCAQLIRLLSGSNCPVM